MVVPSSKSFNPVTWVASRPPFGSPYALAKHLEVTYPSALSWVKNRAFPAKRVAEIVELTGCAPYILSPNTHPQWMFEKQIYTEPSRKELNAFSKLQSEAKKGRANDLQELKRLLKKYGPELSEK